VPAVVDMMMQRGEFLTAYTPYQPEMSQGVLQAIFEYQTAICELTGMDVSNASGYDGTTVAADACYVAKLATGRTKVVVAETLSPQARQVVRTFAPGFGMEVVEVPHTDGATDPDQLAAAADGAALVIFQQPNFLGVLEDAPALAAAADAGGALPVAYVDPMSLGVLEAPGRYGCALAIGEGQPAGNYLSYGGPQYGFLAARQDYARQLPGRIVGETVDLENRRGFVLTLQTREQHIRREKATSNITSNQTLLALGGLVYLSWLGPAGLREVGECSHALAEHAKRRLGLPPAFDRPTLRRGRRGDDEQRGGGKAGEGELGGEVATVHVRVPCDGVADRVASALKSSGGLHDNAATAQAADRRGPKIGMGAIVRQTPRHTLSQRGRRPCDDSTTTLRQRFQPPHAAISRRLPRARHARCACHTPLAAAPRAPRAHWSMVRADCRRRGRRRRRLPGRAGLHHAAGRGSAARAEPAAERDPVERR